MKIVLASLSPRRKELLGQIPNIELEVRPSNVDEDDEPDMPPHELTMHLAKKKATAVYRKGETVLAADTVVVRDGQILTKPSTKEEAIQMLMSLSGRSHLVITGVCLLSDKGEKLAFDQSTVEFTSFSLSDILPYIETKKCFDKAGSYGIQDDEIKRITKSVCGSVSNIIGLPLELLYKILGENI